MTFAAGRWQIISHAFKDGVMAAAPIRKGKAPTTPAPNLATPAVITPRGFPCVALLLQGGGALGAFQGGVYEALAAARVMRDVPAEVCQTEEARMLREFADRKVYNVVQLICRAQAYQAASKDYNFSRRSMMEHRQSGLADAELALSHAEILQRRRCAFPGLRLPPHAGHPAPRRNRPGGGLTVNEADRPAKPFAIPLTAPPIRPGHVASSTANTSSSPPARTRRSCAPWCRSLWSSTRRW